MAGWSIPPTAFIDQIENDLVKQARIIAMALLGEVVLRSPVDTGRFRGNTMVSIGTPVFATTDKVDKDGAATIAAGQAALLGLKPYTQIFLQNNLAYARSSRMVTLRRLRMECLEFPSPVWRRHTDHDLQRNLRRNHPADEGLHWH